MSIRIPDFSSAKILVVGDLMLDRYWSGSAKRVSPEAPVPVVNIDQQEDRLGGAANVAANARRLGAQVGLLGILGDDEAADSIEQLLAAQSINSYCVRNNKTQTITKLRVLSQDQQMIRLDFEETISTDVSPLLIEKFSTLIEGYSVVVFSDYAKGTLHNIPELIEIAKSKQKLVLVDPKGTEFAKYSGADFLTPNQNEFELIAGNSASEEGFIQKASAMRSQLKVVNLLVTRGAQGMFLSCPEQGHHIKSTAKDVHDVTGAGDTVIATLAAALASGETPLESVKLANVAAGVVVGKVGTATLDQQELRNALHRQGIGGRGHQEESELLKNIQNLQQQNKKIVMTNGCFDILHAGHIAFLEEAKAQGDYLLVAVNDDASVQELKGAERPVNQLNDRLAVLAALSAVDWVIPFSEDTPRDLIARLLPNILVKGGDYEVENIAGATEVIAAGGEVRVLSFYEGRSTTRIIDKIRNTQ